MSFDYDVTIIGAGPIGSSLAYNLARENLKVCLIDKKKVIGLPLQCAGIVNKRILSLNEIPEDLILNHVKGANLHSKSHSLSVSKDETQAFIIDRVGLDQFLFNRAIKNDVDCHLSSKVVNIDSESGLVEFKSESTVKSISSKIIVGADGPQSLVSKSLGNEIDTYDASQYLVKVENIENMEFVDLYAGENLFPGFIWNIPVYKNIYRIGMFSNYNCKEQSEILDKFLEKEFNHSNYEVLEKYKGKIPIFNGKNLLVKNRVLLIGDAASQVKPTTGGGLLIGFESVQFAFKSIVKSLEESDLEILNDYANDFEKRFSKEFSYQFKVQKTLCTLSDEDLDYFFIKLKEKEADKLISEYGDMDNQSALVKEFLKRGLILDLLPAIHKRELAKIWLLK
ncbi:NAD(P)/FAD-dependent oxidoreductase [uncultured Methanobrevibacter sp.]|uniref:geranylgeranyl reductase family protein n=1 Tax=uncultured Methanobrevibacter sp. TaxID=253161 RepID=UPI002616BDC6